MIFSFKFSYDNITLNESKLKIKDNLSANIREGKAKIKFLWHFFFIWYWGRLEYTSTTPQGTDIFERTHILSIGFIKKKREIVNISGIHIVNILYQLIVFLFPFYFWVCDGDGDALARILSLLFFILASVASYKNYKYFAKELTEWMKRENHFYDDN